MPAPESIIKLVHQFQQHSERLKRPDYGETQVRVEFINPFFEALGWDVLNKQGYAEAYKEVVHEDAVRIDGMHKAPDYGFRIGGQRKFFVEAKKPSVDLRADVSPAYQLRRYAWSAKLPLSILTDFEEMAVYDCRSKPDKSDSAATGRVMYFRCTDYLDKWDEIAAIFAPESIRKGSFDAYAESNKAKRGTAEVDDAFLADIEQWREALARSLALRNPAITTRELNFAVQQTLDRIIFLRICEARGLEQYGTLQSLLNGGGTYARLMVEFRRADNRYNSGLFHFANEKAQAGYPDELTPTLHIDDKALKEIINRLYYPESPYEFAVIPADILGQIYEQFLGKVIRLTPGHQAKVEEKPEVKKAGGVYYTPTYIVDYIVRQTVGRLVEGKRPGPLGGVSKLRIVDPACGSGSFLLGAYQFLLDWHLQAYMEDGPEQWARKSNPQLRQTGKGDWRLTLEERKRILLNNIYGVDIDAQAVEVTKLSLLLKVLEGESGETLAPQMKLIDDRLLPDLARNIRCGNSLIGPDYYAAQQMTLLDEDEMVRVNVFDWHAAFAGIFAEGGFDAVIGNPPYVRQELLKSAKQYFSSKYATYRATADLYVYFIELGKRILRPSGRFGMIISNKWMRAEYGRPVREFLSNQVNLESIVDFAGLPVFEGATVRTAIALYVNEKADDTLQYTAPVQPEEFIATKSVESLSAVVETRSKTLRMADMAAAGWSFSGSTSSKLIGKVREGNLTLEAYLPAGKMRRGLTTGLNKAFFIDRDVYSALVRLDDHCDEILKPAVMGKDVRRYHIDYQGQYLVWTFNGVNIQEYQPILKHLQEFQPGIGKRFDQGYNWWNLRACDYYELFTQPKIIYPDIATGCRFAFDDTGYFSTNTTWFLAVEDMYLLGLLNSRLGFFYFREVCASLEGGSTSYLRFIGQYIEDFPVKVPAPNDKPNTQRRLQIGQCARSLLDLNKALQSATLPHLKEAYRAQIAATDRKIDELVYELYGLTDKEVAIVEGQAAAAEEEDAGTGAA